MKHIVVLAVCLVALAPVAVAAPAGGPAGQTGVDTGTGIDAAAADTSTTLTVKVRDPSGNPIKDANVTISYGKTTRSESTLSNGNAYFDVPELVTVTITVQHPDYVRNNELVVENPVENDEVTATMYPPAKGTISVNDSSGPVAGATVRLWKDGEGSVAAVGTTDQNGEWQTPAVEEGEYRITVTKDGYYDKRVDATLADTIDRSISVEEGTKSVTFTVVDGHLEGHPKLSGATVTIKHDGATEGSVVTGDSGTAGIVLPINTRYTVVVEKDGYKQVRRILELDEDAKSLTYEISRTDSLSVKTDATAIVVGQPVTVTVTDEYGEPVEGATIRFGDESVGTTDTDGKATVTVEQAGEIAVSANHEGVTSQSVTIRGVEEKPDTTEKPTTEKPTTEKPTTEKPTTEKPTTEKPTTEKSTTTSETTVVTTVIEDTATEEEGTPGFTALVALVAIGLSLLAVRRR